MLAQNDPERPPEDSKESKEPPKSMSKLVRVMTVFAYLSSVSMAAVLLSIYYLCIWKSPVLSDLDLEVGHQHGESFDYQRGYINNDSAPYNFSGGSDSAINDSNIPLPASSDIYPDNHGSSEVVDPSIAENSTLVTPTEHFNSTSEPATNDNESSTIENTLII